MARASAALNKAARPDPALPLGRLRRWPSQDGCLDSARTVQAPFEAVLPSVWPILRLPFLRVDERSPLQYVLASRLRGRSSIG